MKKILEFLSENFQFLVVKVSVYLNRRVFVMFRNMVWSNGIYTSHQTYIYDLCFEQKYEKNIRIFI